MRPRFRRSPPRLSNPLTPSQIGPRGFNAPGGCAALRAAFSASGRHVWGWVLATAVMGAGAVGCVVCRSLEAFGLVLLPQFPITARSGHCTYGATYLCRGACPLSFALIIANRFEQLSHSSLVTERDGGGGWPRSLGDWRTAGVSRRPVVRVLGSRACTRRSRREVQSGSNGVKCRQFRRAL